MTRMLWPIEFLSELRHAYLTQNPSLDFSLLPFHSWPIFELLPQTARHLFTALEER
jgi:hypothetical protein